MENVMGGITLKFEGREFNEDAHNMARNSSNLNFDCHVWLLDAHNIGSLSAINKVRCSFAQKYINLEKVESHGLPLRSTISALITTEAKRTYSYIIYLDHK